MPTRHMIAVCIALIIQALSPCNAETTAGLSRNALVFGIVPQQAADKLAQVWNPLLAYLSEKTGRTFIFESAPDIDAFDKRIANGDFDLAYMNPLLYTEVHQSVGYQVFAKERDTLLKGIVVVQKDSPYQKLEDLADKTIAFPSPNSFASALLPLIEFKSRKINITPIYVGSHEGVYNDVARGLHIAGGGVAKSLAQSDSLIRDELRVLWSSESYAPHPIAFHPRVDRALVEQLSKIMFELDQSETGKKLLKDLHFRGFVAAHNTEYEKLKLLNRQK